MITLTQEHRDALLKRCFKAKQFDSGSNINHWISVSEQPIAFFGRSSKTILLDECNRLGIECSQSQTKIELISMLLDAETVYFRVMIEYESKTVLHVVKSNTTVMDLIETLNGGVDHVKYHHLSMNKSRLNTTETFGDISLRWKAYHNGYERYIIILSTC